jgi:transcriptional regulator GlxA family with amidase domain
MKAQIILFNGFDELDAVAPFEVLQSAASAGADIQVQFVTLDGAEEVTAAHGLRVRPDAQLELSGRPDILVVPGGNWNSRAFQGAWAEAQRGEVPAMIARMHQASATIAAVCTGSMLVAAAGLLTGRPAITHHQAVEELRATGAEVVQARVVDDGDIITAGGITSGLDLALWLVERYVDAQTAHILERQLEYERRGTVWRRSK